MLTAVNSHGRGAVEVRHLRVARVAARNGGVAQPVTAHQDDQDEQQDGRHHPDGFGESAQTHDVNGQSRTGNGDDPGAHHRREPIGTDVAQHLDPRRR